MSEEKEVRKQGKAWDSSRADFDTYKVAKDYEAELIKLGYHRLDDKKDGRQVKIRRSKKYNTFTVLTRD